MLLRSIHKQRESHSIFLLVILFLVSKADLQSQSSPVYYQHYNYEQFVNPAITGRDLYPLVSLSHKKYWIGTENSPNVTCLGGSFRLGQFDFYTPTKMLNKGKLLSKNRMGFGGFLLYEQNGPLRISYASANYAYFVPLNRNSTTELSFGMSLQLSHYNIDEGVLNPTDPGDPELQNFDKMPVVFDGGFGIYFHTKQFYMGASANELFASQYTIEDENLIKNRQDFFFQTGYKFYLKRFDLDFGALIDNDPFYYYGQLKAYYKSYNWIALAYKSTQTLTASIGMRVRKMHIAYAYEHSISRMSSYFSSAHEIMLGLNIGLFEPEGIKKTVKRRP